MFARVENAFGKVYYKIEFKEELNIIQAEWYGFTTKQDLKKALVVGLQLHEETRCAYRLNDNTAFSGPWADAVSWLEEEWLPKAYEAGIRYLAHIARPSSFGELAGEALQTGKIGATIEVKIFTEKEEALNWLKAKQELANV
ncbi:hypothetical protein [Pontibacter cellulosilyticus]|uniref:STAS/SEC14 domain-containing protein n=1 Tax=Pontibacter cellulosilyticus TaxID=1720253 RepID=A0A923N6C2_9BACT|nr:hypothetical protein [Pontibacter cellulosilyticus]MBC5993463.1 hypothetical protein [Pontibacter cellulosilyticus]